MIAGAPELHLKLASQIACGRRGENVGETSLQGPALGRDRRGGEGFDAIGQGKGPPQPEAKPRWQHVLARLVDVGDIPGEMGETGLMRHAVPLLRRIAVGTPDLRPVAVHQVAHHDGAAGRSGAMDNRLARAEHPLKGVAALDPDTGLVGCHDLCPAQGSDGRVALGRER